MMNGSSNTMVEYQVLLFFKRSMWSETKSDPYNSFTCVELGHHFLWSSLVGSVAKNGFSNFSTSVPSSMEHMAMENGWFIDAHASHLWNMAMFSTAIFDERRVLNSQFLCAFKRFHECTQHWMMLCSVYCFVDFVESYPCDTSHNEFPTLAFLQESPNKLGLQTRVNPWIFPVQSIHWLLKMWLFYPQKSFYLFHGLFAIFSEKIQGKPQHPMLKAHDFPSFSRSSFVYFFQGYNTIFRRTNPERERIYI